MPNRNRRKYDSTSIHDLLVQHMEEDGKQFKKLDRCEYMLWTIIGGVILLGFLISNPMIFHNLTAEARAEVGER